MEKTASRRRLSASGRSQQEEEQVDKRVAPSWNHLEPTSWLSLRPPLWNSVQRRWRRACGGGWATSTTPPQWKRCRCRRRRRRCRRRGRRLLAFVAEPVLPWRRRPAEAEPAAPSSLVLADRCLAGRPPSLRPAVVVCLQANGREWITLLQRLSGRSLAGWWAGRCRMPYPYRCAGAGSRLPPPPCCPNRLQNSLRPRG